MAILLLLIGNTDIVRFKAGRERKLEQVQIAVIEIQALAAALARSVLVAIEGGARMGGVPNDLKTEVMRELLDALQGISMPDDVLERTLSDYRRYVEFDYAHYILGGCEIPDVQNPNLQNEWRELIGGGLSRTPTPEALEQFLNRWGLLSQQKREQIDDYRHYLETREHRRPDFWEQREHWGRLSTSNR